MRQSPPPVRKLMNEESFWNEVFERIGEGGSLRGGAPGIMGSPMRPCMTVFIPMKNTVLLDFLIFEPSSSAKSYFSSIVIP